MSESASEHTAFVRTVVKVQPIANLELGNDNVAAHDVPVAGE